MALFCTGHFLLLGSSLPEQICMMQEAKLPNAFDRSSNRHALTWVPLSSALRVALG